MSNQTAVTSRTSISELPEIPHLSPDDYIILQSDDEGNDGGAAWVYNPKKDIDETIYTL